ncbi:DUF1593 domain-containing protein [Aestuariibaculum sp. M13]|uniref:DUF1593 domain-containing protein n=1 Tax=Aestuariibaculum sp. M13 TaxID=2967132 RepID=UPI002159DA00|nr:DUF1593 domain-containing protein [Aestuariibaculum sp. M13]MCR8668973.1 DUF1593 domain-containing protein [Aestuariibaculum sp. M13]
MKHIIILILTLLSYSSTYSQNEKPRVIVTTDGEADDRASMVRFLLTSNEFDIEGIINSSSQFHWVGGEGWHAFHDVNWIKDYINLYAKVYNNLLLHDSNYPSPEYLLSKWKVGNINEIGEDYLRTDGAKLIASVLLDNTDKRPIWLQAWGGCNTISRALKIIQEDHPERMSEIAKKTRLFLIWEQDETYQNYIRPNWEHLKITTIISDQFDCMAYIWHKVLPDDIKSYFESKWMEENILTNHGALCDAYENNHGAFNAEGDTPAFLHNIPNGLRSTESPDFGGWGGRYTKVRNNVWMDLLPDSETTYPEGQRSIHNSWSKKMEHDTVSNKVTVRNKYFKPLWMWLEHVQNDFAARADWCVNDYNSANHHPIVNLKNTPLNITTKAGSKIKLDASKSFDPDNDDLHITWWNYTEANTYSGQETIPKTQSSITKFILPKDAQSGDTFHMICEVTDSGSPSLTRYKRVIITISE